MSGYTEEFRKRIIATLKTGPVTMHALIEESKEYGMNRDAIHGILHILKPTVHGEGSEKRYSLP